MFTYNSFALNDQIILTLTVVTRCEMLFGPVLSVCLPVIDWGLLRSVALGSTLVRTLLCSDVIRFLPSSP